MVRLSDAARIHGAIGLCAGTPTDLRISSPNSPSHDNPANDVHADWIRSRAHMNCPEGSCAPAITSSNLTSPRTSLFISQCERWSCASSHGPKWSARAASQCAGEQQKLRLHCGQGMRFLGFSDVVPFFAASIRISWSVRVL